MDHKYLEKFMAFLRSNHDPKYKCFIETPSLLVKCTTCNKLISYMKTHHLT